MTALRDPSPELMLSYAAGALSTPEALVIETHLSLRPASRTWAAIGNEIGGALLEDIPPTPMQHRTLSTLLRDLDDKLSVPTDVLSPVNTTLPRPLSDHKLGPWRWRGPGVRSRDVIGVAEGNCRAILLMIAPGQSAPMHTHAGVELTCVIEGAYETGDGVFGPGDFEAADASVTHRPKVVSKTPCLCIAALDGQIVLPGSMGKILAPFVRL